MQMREDLNRILRELLEEKNNSNEFSDEEKLRAAYALNMCMVSVSQIIDYDDLIVLEQEYDGILNNLNIEMMPKDEALLVIIKRLLDTITFFRIQEGEKKIIDKEYQQKMKNAIWSAVPNFGLIIAGGNPVSMAVSLASQVGIGYMNYRRTKCENNLEYEKQQWQLQQSAIEQFNGLRRELFDTAWRLADKYDFPDEYRLTERQIKQYNEILMDYDEIRKYERLTTIKDKFNAYPPFWYHYGNTANHIARDISLNISNLARQQYRSEAINHFERYWVSNKYALLREDQIASSCALEHVDLLDPVKDKEKICELLEKAVKFSGYSNDILQLCAIAYLRIGEKTQASKLLRILVNEQYNIVVNAQILSGLYVNRVLETGDAITRSKYETLATRVNNDYLVRLPAIGENVSEEELKNDFSEKQEELLIAKFSAVLTRYFNDFSISLGKLIPGPNPKTDYPDYYYSEEGLEQRIKDINELFSSNYKQKKRSEYLDRLSQCGFVTAYFKELNRFFDEISSLNCIRDRQKLQELISNRILESSAQINAIAKRIEEKKVTAEDMYALLSYTSKGMFSGFIDEIEEQINITVIGMNEMAKYAAADTKLREFCNDYNLPEPDRLLLEGNEAKSDTGLVSNYFGFDLLGEDGFKLQQEQQRYRKIESVICEYMPKLNSISEKSNAYFHDSDDFNTYFESSKLKNHKDILQKTIAVFDDKSFTNVDVLFTVDGVVPVVRNSIKKPIPYILLANDDEKQRIIDIVKNNMSQDKVTMVAMAAGVAGIGGLPSLLIGGAVAVDTRSINHVIEAVRPMIDEICYILVEELTK